jgi:hypothetical protein
MEKMRLLTQKVKIVVGAPSPAELKKNAIESLRQRIKEIQQVPNDAELAEICFERIFANFLGKLLRSLITIRGL